MHPRRLRFLLAAMPSLLLFTSMARAETAPSTCAAQVFPSGEGVPSNLPALVIESDGNAATFEAGVSQAGLEFTGGSIALDFVESPSARELVVAPHSALQEDITYSVSYTIGCDANKAHSSSFVVGPAVPLPTSVGTAAAMPDGKVTVTPSDDLLAFMSTSRFAVMVDGVKSVVPTRYGAVSAGAFTVSNIGTALAFNGREATLATTTACPDGGKVHHSIALTAHVAGTTTETTPLTFDIDFDCTPAQPTGIPDDAGNMAGDAANDDGCNVGGNPGSSLALFFGVGFVATVLFRRRRS